MIGAPACARAFSFDDASPPLAARVAGRQVRRGASCPGRGRAVVAAAALLCIFSGKAVTLAAQAPQATFTHALRVSANLPLRGLARDSLRTVSLGATPALGVAILPPRGPLRRLLLDAAPAMLRVDPGSGCTEFNGYTCESQAVYGLTLSAAAETGARTRLGAERLLYVVAGPALRFHGYFARPDCTPDELPCTEADRYSSARAGIGAHAALGLRRLGTGRHLSTEAAATLLTYSGARTQLDLGVTVAFPF